MSAPMAQFLPAFAKGPVVRPIAPSRPRIQKEYHKAMEQGRFVETAIGDAIFDLKKAKADLEDKVKACLRDIVLGSDGEFPDSLRPAKFILDIVKFAKEMKEFIDEILGTIKALIECILLLQAILKNMMAMLQSILNALAALLGEICNWNLPKLPSLPNLLGDFSWGFPGFNLQGIKAGMPKFDLKFTFPQCKISLPSTGVFANYPPGLTLPDGTGINCTSVPSTSGTFESPTGPPITLPVNEQLGGPLVTPEQAADPAFQANYLAPTSSTPFFPDSFNPASDAIGSLPNPAKVLNNYQMPAATYEANVVSLIPELLPMVLPQDAEPPPPSTFKQLLRDHVTLERVFDTRNLHITTAWILYLSKSRAARKGQWIPEYQELFDTYIVPSATYLSGTPVPYNGFDPANVVDGPTGIPLLLTLHETPDPVLLWKLSYIEASLLGYVRTRRWDVNADPTWHGYTDEDLDFMPVQMGERTLSITLDSGGLAIYPVSINIYPGWLAEINSAINRAAYDILKNEEWRTQRSQFRYIYDQFAMATEVDRFSQFWREWKANFDDLIALEDPTVLPYVLDYWETTNSKVNPLSNTALYDYIRRDTLERRAGWVPGDDLIDLPTAMPAGISNYVPTEEESGWTGDVFNVNAFLSRPDIKILPVNTQLAMMDLNIAFATASQNSAVSQAAIASQLSALKALTASSIIKGFKLSNSKSVVIRPAEKLLLKFNTTELDITGNVTATNLYTIQAGGSYSIKGTFIFDVMTLPRVAKVEVWINDVAVYTDISPSTIDQTVVHLNHSLSLVKGDVIQVKAFHTGLESQVLLVGYTFECMASAVDTSAGDPGGGAGGGAGNTDPFTSAAGASAAGGAGVVTDSMPGAGVAAIAAQQAAQFLIGLSGTGNSGAGSAVVGAGNEQTPGSGGAAGSGGSTPAAGPGAVGMGGADGKGNGVQVLQSGGMVPEQAPGTTLFAPAITTPTAGFAKPAGASLTDTQLVAGSFNWGIHGGGLKQMPAGTDLSSLMAIYTNSDGKALPIHPETDTTDVPYFDGVTLNTVQANQTVTVALYYGQEYQIAIQTIMPLQPPPNGELPVQQRVVRELADPYADPTYVEAQQQGDALPTGNLRTGKMLYVGPGGYLTHDFDFVKANCRWICAVGRATAKDKFIYEPHIPMDQMGGGGGGPAVGVYTHVQSSPATIWTVHHNLGRYVNVEVYDSDGDAVVHDKTFFDLNTVVVRVMVATAGHAACA